MTDDSMKPPVFADDTAYPGQYVLRLPLRLIRDMRRDPLTENQLLTDIGYFPHAKGHFWERPVGDRYLVAIYCVRGRGWVQYKGRRAEMHPGDMVLLPPNVPHAYGAHQTDPWTIYWMHAEGTQILRLVDEITKAAGGVIVRVGDVPAIVRLFNEAFEQLKESYGRVNLVAASLCAANLLGQTLCRQRAAHFQSEEASDRIEHILELMRSRVCGDVNVTELAAAANLSASRFSVLFKKRTGFSVKNFFIGLKIRQGCHLLDSTRLSIKAIAKELGFEDQLYFSRQFRKVQGLSPKEYRGIKKG